MRTKEQSDAAVVAAARAGDQRALAELLEEYLPLVYNVVGRALDGHADVDDVVQETMERAVTGLAGLADPERFRSWLVAIALNQVRQRAGARAGQLDEAVEVADPGADFAEVTVLRLGLSGQRREVVEATRWLERDEREVLSLWWLEAAGELTRAELAAACELAPKHAAVRVQR
ncbi:RNA polymerase sigma factor, partial [Streptomyces milbemycinicus]|uniref:RNA polymerase sigma factor n=1 Tax=Streptomyces milbemycinicus TaxID=476552 RepID=UPI00117BEECA